MEISGLICLLFLVLYGLGFYQLVKEEIDPYCESCKEIQPDNVGSEESEQ